MMTTEQAHRLRVLMQEALELVLGRPIAFVLVAQDEARSIEIVTNAERRDLLPDLLQAAADIVRTPPDNIIHDHRATGESAGVKSAQEATPGMECGHAAPGALQPADHGRGVDGAAQPMAGSREVATTPPAAAVSERCNVKDGDVQCPHNAVGGLRVNLYAALSVQKRYGRRVMLSMIMDLPICLACMPKVTPLNLFTEEQWTSFSRVAQQRNSGILVDRYQTEIVLCRFDDPEYQVLRKETAKRAAANESQPAPAGPQQGAGDGT